MNGETRDLANTVTSANTLTASPIGRINQAEEKEERIERRVKKHYPSVEKEKERERKEIPGNQASKAIGKVKGMTKDARGAPQEDLSEEKVVEKEAARDHSHRHTFQESAGTSSEVLVTQVKLALISMTNQSRKG
jgi:hypothetical protein